MAAPALDVAAARRRFPALARPLVFLDGPGGTQVPDTVIEAITGYLSESNANLGGPFPTSRESDLVVSRARIAAAAFLGCSPDEVGFGPNMTTLNFTLSRAVGRELAPGDEIVATRLDHDANVAPWLELARDRDLVVRLVDLTDDCRLDLADLERQLSERTRIVAFPWASNAVGTITDVRRVVDLAHEAGALAWVDAVHFAPHGPIDVGGPRGGGRGGGPRNMFGGPPGPVLGGRGGGGRRGPRGPAPPPPAPPAGAPPAPHVLLCSPYKFFGPHLGLFYGRREVLERWRPYKVRPADDEPVGHRFETGTQPHEALAGFVAAVEYVRSVGWDAIRAHERELSRRFLDGLPARYRLHGPAGPDGRTPTFAITHPTLSPWEVAQTLGERGVAVWPGNYYALEVMQRLGLEDGAVRIGFVHYNTADEVDRVLAELDDLARPRGPA